jgi:transcription antitermination factor NusG
VRHLTYSDYLDKQGKRVRIIDGNFAGVEGVIKRIKRDRIVVVLLKGIAAVAITQLPPSFIELIDDNKD